MGARHDIQNLRSQLPLLPHHNRRRSSGLGAERDKSGLQLVVQTPAMTTAWERLCNLVGYGDLIGPIQPSLCLLVACQCPCWAAGRIDS